MRSLVFFLLVVLGCNVGIGQDCGFSVIKQAEKDVNYTEGGAGKNNNKGQLFDYYRGNVDFKLNNWNAPYCGCALYTWFVEAGYSPNVRNPSLAISWHGKNAIRLGRATSMSVIEKLSPGMAINMKFRLRNGKVNNHVGVLEKPYPTYALNIEANTSDPNDPKKYGKREGVFRKIRPWYRLHSATNWCETAKVAPKKIRTF